MVHAIRERIEHERFVCIYFYFMIVLQLIYFQNYCISASYIYTYAHIFTGIKFPVAIRDIEKFERRNAGFQIDVLSVEMEERDDGEEYSIIFPLHISKVVACDDRHAITLFYNSNEETCHYSLITPRKYIWLQNRSVCV